MQQSQWEIAKMSTFGEKSTSVYVVGVKGTGCSSLAVLLKKYGVEVRGSDREEVFPTDEVLEQAAIAVESFEHDPGKPDFAVYSAAYNPETHPQLISLAERGVPLYSYFEALGKLMETKRGIAVAGTHGKTTTTALIGIAIAHRKAAAAVVCGAPVGIFSDGSTHYGGDEWFVVEACEYNRQFLHLKPEITVVTSLDLDHVDTYADLEETQAAFMALARQTSRVLIYNADDPGLRRMVQLLEEEDLPLAYIGYGEQAHGELKILDRKTTPNNLRVIFTPPSSHRAPRIEMHAAEGEEAFQADAWVVPLPGEHTERNLLAAVGVLRAMDEPVAIHDFFEFGYIKRRSEFKGLIKAQIPWIDDYAHHPAAIETTLKGYRKAYKPGRIVLSFMPHTYTRTKHFLNEFAASFMHADVLFLHDIYGSAREKIGADTVSSKDIVDLLAQMAPRLKVYYVPDWHDAALELKKVLHAGDLFVTMGAGDNWKLGYMVKEKQDA